jgi:hypothetical protein
MIEWMHCEFDVDNYTYLQHSEKNYKAGALIYTNMFSKSTDIFDEDYFIKFNRFSNYLGKIIFNIIFKRVQKF